LIDEFYAQEGLMHFSDSKDKADDECEVFFDKAETKVMTRSEYAKAEIAPPPASKAPYPRNRRSRSLSPKPTSQSTPKTTSPVQTPKVPLSTQVAHQVAKGRGHKVNITVARDMLLESTDPGHKPGSMTVNHLVPSPKPTSVKTFASVASTPKVKPQQASPTVQTSTKPLHAKTDAKKAPPNKVKQAPKNGPNQFKGKVDSKPKQVTMSQKLADASKQMAIKAKQADKNDSPKMKKPFDGITTPIKTTYRIVETSDGKGFQLLSEEQKQEVDRVKRFEAIGLLHFSDDEEDELSLETIISDKSKGSNKSQGSKKPIAKPKPKQPVAPKQPVKPKQPIRPNQPSNVMLRTVSNQVKENEMTPFHKDALSSAGGLTTPVNKGSSIGGWITKGAGKRTPNVFDIFSPKNVGNMLGMRDPPPPNSDSDNGSAGSNKSNRYAVLQDNEEEEVSDATTDILPIEEIPESIQEGAVLIQPDSNETPDNIQVEVAEPVVEGGNTPQEEDLQPDGVVSSEDADFIKAESE